MTVDQISVFAILFLAMVLFVVNHWRYDIVAGFALLAGVYSGVVPTDRALDGFAHPAVVTVACVLVISKALQSCGVVELFLKYMALVRGSAFKQRLANCGLTALLSAFMNNIGALALMMPITIKDASKAKRPASTLLMPLSFASLLGGLVTMIGTPTNIIIASFREESTGEPFGMFDFTPVGLPVAIAGVMFIVTIGWRFLPKRVNIPDTENPHQFHIAKYITELRIPAESALIGETIGDLEKRCEDEISIMAIVTAGRRRLAPHTIEQLYADDVLIVEGESEALQPLFEDVGLVEAGSESVDARWLKSPDIRVIEAVVMPDALIEGQSMRGIYMHEEYGVNLLGVARENKPSSGLLKAIKFKVGDLLLLQGENTALDKVCRTLGCLALKNRGVDITQKRGALLTPLIFGLGIFAAAMNWLPVHIAFLTVVGALVLAKLVSLREAYQSIQWPVIILLGFLIPLGGALQHTGGDALIANGIINLAQGVPLWGILVLLMGSTMILSDVIPNTPAAVLMAPVSLSLASGMQYSPDAFLMTVAIGAASPYLTPIGHQSNTLVLGPGGYNFSDYWRMGLPLDIVIISVSVPMILWVWA
ncbi:MAG: di/tricarboxylate transporter [Saprospiraceae bacterium]|jgi:di/tricarboxylate transporter